MTCALGFGYKIGDVHSMAKISEIACAMYYKLAKTGGKESYIQHAEAICSFAKKHISGSFQDFAHDFCQNASPLVKATAAVIDRDFQRFCILSAVVGGAVTVALKVSSARAQVSSDREHMNYLSYVTGLATVAMTFISIRLLN